MQFKSIAVLASLGLLAVATPTPNSAPQCTTGELECCNSVESSNNPVVATLLGLLGIVLGPISVPVGLTCSPVTVSLDKSEVCSRTKWSHSRSELEVVLAAPRPWFAARTTASVSKQSS